MLGRDADLHLLQKKVLLTFSTPSLHDFSEHCAHLIRLIKTSREVEAPRKRYVIVIENIVCVIVVVMAEENLFRSASFLSI